VVYNFNFNYFSISVKPLTIQPASSCVDEKAHLKKSEGTSDCSVGVENSEKLSPVSEPQDHTLDNAKPSMVLSESTGTGKRDKKAPNLLSSSF